MFHLKINMISKIFADIIKYKLSGAVEVGSFFLIIFKLMFLGRNPSAYLK